MDTADVAWLWMHWTLPKPAMKSKNAMLASIRIDQFHFNIWHWPSFDFIGSTHWVQVYRRAKLWPRVLPLQMASCLLRCFRGRVIKPIYVSWEIYDSKNVHWSLGYPRTLAINARFKRSMITIIWATSAGPPLLSPFLIIWSCFLSVYVSFHFLTLTCLNSDLDLPFLSTCCWSNLGSHPENLHNNSLPRNYQLVLYIYRVLILKSTYFRFP